MPERNASVSSGMAGLNVMFRADASTEIGSGHVMRCLTLADALRDRGARCHFICREHPGARFDRIGLNGHALTVLPPGERHDAIHADLPPHAAWLGCDWRIDAAQTRLAMEPSGADWLVVDHYALDQRWEECLTGSFGKLLVIDDLADRPHACDVLLDQTHGRRAADYEGLVPAYCRVLAGTDYALLRPEFAALRAASLQRRMKAALRHVLVSMGGIDQADATGGVLATLGDIDLPAGCRISVVMGSASPHLAAVRAQAATLRWPTQVFVDVEDMARLMADADLAIGAAGGTAWERCCLGLPSIVLVLADNQRNVATSLDDAGAAVVIADGASIMTALGCELRRLIDNPSVLSAMSLAASKVTDGRGVEAVIAALEAHRD